MFLLLALSSCKKFLDAKSNQSQAIPETIPDLQALLDHYQQINYVDGNAAEVSTDDVYLNDADFAARTENERNMYTWQRSNIFLQDSNEWFYNYRVINRTNVVLESIRKIDRNAGNAFEWDNVSGQAYYLRAKNHLRGLYIWGNAYNEQSAGDPGIPLKLTSDFNEPSTRATVVAGYAQVISDLKRAAAMLPMKAVHVMRPSRPAALGLLARTYWSMRKYDLALLYADSCLMLKSDLLDYNVLNAAAAYPIGQFNAEVLQDSYLGSSPVLTNSRAKINPLLYAMYEANDLRKTVFFNDNKNGTFGFKGSYEGNANLFSGVAVNEVLLIRSESLARAGKLSEALADLNRLLRNRYKKNTFTERTGTGQKEVLDQVLAERRKELLLRGLRWVDVKRLNREDAGISFSRSIKGTVYNLVAKSSGFALPIPERVIEVAGFEQNP